MAADDRGGDLHRGDPDLVRRSDDDWRAMRRDVADIKSDVRDLKTQVIGTAGMPGAIPELRREVQLVRKELAEAPRTAYLVRSAQLWNTQVKILLGTVSAVAAAVLGFWLAHLVGVHP